MTSTRANLEAVLFYVRTIAVGLPITTFWRICVAEELAPDMYLYRLLHLTGVFVGCFIGMGVAARRPRLAPAAGGARGS